MKNIILFSIFLLSISSYKVAAKEGSDQKKAAERFFKGIYGCEHSVVDQLAGDSVMVSYPIFETLFGKPTLRGRKDVKDFAIGFCSRWEVDQITIHDSIEEDNKVILLWSFKATFIGQSQTNGPKTNTEHSWGGITIFYFNDEGKIITEIGEESKPGPFERIQ